MAGVLVVLCAAPAANAQLLEWAGLRGNLTDDWTMEPTYPAVDGAVCWRAGEGDRDAYTVRVHHATLCLMPAGRAEAFEAARGDVRDTVGGRAFGLTYPDLQSRRYVGTHEFRRSLQLSKRPVPNGGDLLVGALGLIGKVPSSYALPAVEKQGSAYVVEFVYPGPARKTMAITVLATKGKASRRQREEHGELIELFSGGGRTVYVAAPRRPLHPDVGALLGSLGCRALPARPKLAGVAGKTQLHPGLTLWARLPRKWAVQAGPGISIQKRVIGDSLMIGPGRRGEVRTEKVILELVYAHHAGRVTAAQTDGAAALFTAGHHVVFPLLQVEGADVKAFMGSLEARPRAAYPVPGRLQLIDRRARVGVDLPPGWSAAGRAHKELEGVRVVELSKGYEPIVEVAVVPAASEAAFVKKNGGMSVLVVRDARWLVFAYTEQRSAAVKQTMTSLSIIR